LDDGFLEGGEAAALRNLDADGVESLVHPVALGADEPRALEDAQVVGERAVGDAELLLDGVVVLAGVGDNIAVDLAPEVLVEDLLGFQFHIERQEEGRYERSL